MIDVSICDVANLLWIESRLRIGGAQYRYTPNPLVADCERECSLLECLCGP